MLIVSASGDGRVLEMGGGDGYVALWMCLIPLNCKVCGVTYILPQ